MFLNASVQLLAEIVTGISSTRAPILTNINDGLLRVTPHDHPLYVRSDDSVGWVRDPSQLQVGWELLDPLDDSWIKIDRITYEPGDFKVYDITTTEPRTYIANGILCEDKKK